LKACGLTALTLLLYLATAAAEPQTCTEPTEGMKHSTARVMTVLMAL